VEAHIEQGPVLAARGAALGVVTSIAGMAGLEIAFVGRRGHAGTVPMPLRADALAAAVQAMGAAYDAARGIPGAVCTIGRLNALPGATNTIPGRAELFADLRAPDGAGLAALVRAVKAAAAEAAAAGGCTVEIEQRWRYQPVPMSAGPTAALRRAIERIGLPVVELPSGAGHDAAIMAMAGVPAAMLFVRGDAGGVSHAPQEHTGIDAVEACLAALERALWELSAR
jgi:hydantoinase/carbamoylase family amidase